MLSITVCVSQVVLLAYILHDSCFVTAVHCIMRFLNHISVI